MPTIGFQDFLDYTNWIFSGSGSFTTSPSGPNSLNLTSNNGEVTYTYASNQLLYSGTLTFDYAAFTGGRSIYINGTPTFLLGTSGSFGPIFVSANSSIVFNATSEGTDTFSITNFQFQYEEGVTAPTGPTGPVGPTGSIGPTGPTGPTGSCVCTYDNLQFGYSINGGPDVILTSESPPSNSGNLTLNMTAGDIFCFKVLNLGNIDTNCGISVDISCFEYKENYPCFKKGSKILCYIDGEERYIPIENIKKGFLVKTLKSGYVPVDMIGTSILYNNGTSENILYNCTNDNYPEIFEDLYITGHHSILVDNLTQKQIDDTREKLGRLYITEGKWRLLACLDNRAIPVTDFKSETIYHIALENSDYYMNYGIYANGLLVETSSKRYLKELSNMKLII